MPVERETIITDREPGSGISGVVLAVLAIVLILVIVGGVTVFNGGFSFGGGTVQVPQVTVTK